MLDTVYEFMFVTVPWWGWYGFGIICLAAAFWPDRNA